MEQLKDVQIRLQAFERLNVATPLLEECEDENWDGNPNTRIVTEYHFYINDDKVHDNLFLQHYFGLHK